MDPLYFLEHQFLPAVVYPGPDGKQISPFLLGNGFGPLCAGVLKDLPEAGEADGPSFQEADFSAEGLEIRNEHTGLPQCYVLADGGLVDTVYLSELSSAAMRRRAQKMVE